MKDLFVTLEGRDSVSLRSKCKEFLLFSIIKTMCPEGVQDRHASVYFKK